ncbi:MAG: hypothetical protein P1U36_06855 [Legionellaceae bacterium]|nr:hypothetical protein [Legionellaceae bacterium]
MKPLKTVSLNTWSPLSNVTVRLKHSRDYLYLLVLVHAFAVIALFQTACPAGLIATLVFVLAAHGSYLWRRKTPAVCCSELTYAKERWWVLDDSTGELLTYTEAQVRFDFGWLMWVVFKEDAALFEKKRQRDVIVFQDQINSDEHRLLRLVLRVHDASHKNPHKNKSKKT